MEVNGRISVEPQNDWLTLTRLKSVSTEDMKRELGKVKDDQSKQQKIIINLYIDSFLFQPSSSKNRGRFK